MAMIKCPECQKEISNTAVNCPNCGCPIISTVTKTKKETILPKNKVYMIAIIHSVIIAVLSLIGRVYYYDFNFFPVGRKMDIYFILSKIIRISIVALVVISIFWIIKYIANKSDVKLLNNCKTIFTTLSSYVLSYSIGFLYYAVSINHRIAEIGTSRIIQVLMIVLLIIGMCLLAKFKMKLNIDFYKYKLSIIIWVIYAVLNSDIFYNFIAFSSIAVISIPVIVGILWIISAIRKKH